MMSDIEILSSDDIHPSSNEKPSLLNLNSIPQYSTSLIESLLKQKGKPKQIIVIKNDQKNLSSPAWSTFGFPAKCIDNSYRPIESFASCFKCKATCSYQFDGSGCTKH